MHSEPKKLSQLSAAEGPIHLAGLPVVPARSLSSFVLGAIALALAALCLYAMIRSDEFSLVPMLAFSLFLIMGLTMFLPNSIAKYSLALAFFLFVIQALMTGKVIGFFVPPAFARTVVRDSEPLYYWFSVAFLVVCASWCIYEAFLIKRRMPPNPSHKGGRSR